MPRYVCWVNVVQPEGGFVQHRRNNCVMGPIALLPLLAAVLIRIFLLTSVSAAEPGGGADAKSFAIQSIIVEPREVLLRGENRRQQLLVTALAASGKSRDGTAL